MPGGHRIAQSLARSWQTDKDKVEQAVALGRDPYTIGVRPTEVPRILAAMEKANRSRDERDERPCLSVCPCGGLCHREGRSHRAHRCERHHGWSSERMLVVIRSAYTAQAS